MKNENENGGENEENEGIVVVQKVDGNAIAKWTFLLQCLCNRNNRLPGQNFRTKDRESFGVSPFGGIGRPVAVSPAR